MGAACGPDISESGLVLCLDSNNRESYPGSGVPWYNLVGTNSGSLVNSPTFTQGSNVLTFNGTNQYLDLGDTNSGIVSGTSTISITAWINPNKFASFDGIVSRTGGVSPYGGWQINLDSVGRVDFALNIAGTWQTYLSKGGTARYLTTSTWYHVAAVYDGSTMRIYVNGSLVGSVAQTGNLAYAGSLSNLYVGRNQSAYFGGSISTVNVYSKALTASEVAQEYNSTRGRFDVVLPVDIVTSGLALYYDFGNTQSYAGSGTSITDLSGNGRTGTLVGSPAYTSGGGGYFTFDTGAKYITLPANIFNNATFSIETWVYQTTQPTTTVIFASQGSNTTGFWGVGSNSGGFWFSTFNGSTRPGLGSGTSLTGAWNHVAVTRDSSNLASLYVNGDLKSSGAVTTSFASGSPLLAVNPINSSERLDGRLSMVRYYTSSLSSNDIRNNFNVHRRRYGV